MYCLLFLQVYFIVKMSPGVIFSSSVFQLEEWLFLYSCEVFTIHLLMTVAFRNRNMILLEQKWNIKCTGKGIHKVAERFSHTKKSK